MAAWCTCHAEPQEIDVDVRSAPADKVLLHRLCELIGKAAVAARRGLRSLRLSGPLHLGVVFQQLAPWAAQFTELEVSRKGRGWLRKGEGQIPGAARHRSCNKACSTAL